MPIFFSSYTVNIRDPNDAQLLSSFTITQIDFSEAPIFTIEPRKYVCNVIFCVNLQDIPTLYRGFQHDFYVFVHVCICELDLVSVLLRFVNDGWNLIPIRTDCFFFLSSATCRGKGRRSSLLFFKNRKKGLSFREKML